MKHLHTQQLDQHPANFWQLFVLLFLLNSLAFAGWVDFRQVTVSAHSGFVAEFDQLTLANQRDHFRSLLDIENLATPSVDDGDNEQHWLVYSSVLILPAAALLLAEDLYYLTLLIISDGKYHLPLNRAPPHQ
ncbi:hypothetical protein [Methylophaga sp.]|jgi:hypothetical protein|uniref:hypothetical protein n=1 Tax=Methylophaga sp. TaxID=2024840 RepID=UPI003F6E6BF5|tara:strand:+ start:441 stop:836 length:396 start_codon:yes stop_codon:yes gene_type:complete